MSSKLNSLLFLVSITILTIMGYSQLSNNIKRASIISRGFRAI